MPALSGAVRRAVAGDRARILDAKSRLDARRAQLHAELADIDAQIRALDERVDLLDRLAGPSPDRQPRAQATAHGGRVLRGAEIRRVATQLLYEQHGAGHAIHYRDWLACLQARGYVVLGAKPEATFLSNILRSPLVVRAEQPGSYYLDDTVAGRLREQLAEQQAQLRDLTTAIAAHGAGAAIASHEQRRTPLSAAVRRCERELAEIDAALGNAHPATPGQDDDVGV